MRKWKPKECNVLVITPTSARFWLKSPKLIKIKITWALNTGIVKNTSCFYEAWEMTRRKRYQKRTGIKSYGDEGRGALPAASADWWLTAKGPDTPVRLLLIFSEKKTKQKYHRPSLRLLLLAMPTFVGPTPRSSPPEALRAGTQLLEVGRMNNFPTMEANH